MTPRKHGQQEDAGGVRKSTFILELSEQQRESLERRWEGGLRPAAGCPSADQTPRSLCSSEQLLFLRI